MSLHALGIHLLSIVPTTPEGEQSRRSRVLATLAMLNVFTLAAAAVVAHMLPPRLAKLKIPVAGRRARVRAARLRHLALQRA